MVKRISNVIGFDDAPFDRNHRGNVMIVGAVFAGTRLDGVICGKVRRDGINSTRTLINLVNNSRFEEHIQAILIQGIAFAGFNVIDLNKLHTSLNLPIMAVSRKQPDFRAIKDALINKVPGGYRKWRLIECLGPMETMEGIYVQRAGISKACAIDLIRRFAINSTLPEPLRTAHIIAGGIKLGESRHRP